MNTPPRDCEDVIGGRCKGELWVRYDGNEWRGEANLARDKAGVTYNRAPEIAFNQTALLEFALSFSEALDPETGSLDPDEDTHLGQLRVLLMLAFGDNWDSVCMAAHDWAEIHEDEVL